MLPLFCLVASEGSEFRLNTPDSIRTIRHGANISREKERRVKHCGFCISKFIMYRHRGYMDGFMWTLYPVQRAVIKVYYFETWNIKIGWKSFKRINADSPEEATAQALIWILEQEQKQE